MAKTYKIPKILISGTGFCPGCGHGIINRILAEVLNELGLEEKTIGVCAVGCVCLMRRSFKIDWIQAQHGRAPAVATGIKRVRPETTVFTYQGDGDLAAIGTAEIIHAAARNENTTTIFVNNGVFGMTGGQMAPTTLPGQKTISSPLGRDTKLTGMPIKISEMLAVLPVAYIARGSVVNAAEINKTKKYIRSAIEAQQKGEGFSMVEVLSPCPTNWHMNPLKSLERLKEEVEKYYPLGEMVKRGGEVICTK